jgi:5'(3')-deoxyribonucleotidase
MTIIRCDNCGYVGYGTCEEGCPVCGGASCSYVPHKTQSTRKRIAFDFDGTLADTISVWIKVFNEMTNATLRKEDITSWEVPEIYCARYGVSSAKIWKTVFSDEIDKVDFTDASLIWQLPMLHQMHDLLIVTRQPDLSYIEGIVDWLEMKDVLQYFKEIHVLREPIKAVVQYDVLFDDHYVTPKSVLIKQPWNDGKLEVSKIYEYVVQHL